MTYIPSAGHSSFVLTSNRDERVFRPTLPPVIGWLNDIKVAFPTDTKAGGSWIAINENGRTCCLLNGAYAAHQKQEHHTRSRGQIVLELASSRLDEVTFFQSIELKNVEPFTMVTIQQECKQVVRLSEFVWDGNQKHFRELDKTTAYIWSSATLYSEKNRHERKLWFDAFIAKSGDDVSPEKILDFHTAKHSKDHSLNLIMKRKGGLRTVSVTQVTGQNSTTRMQYSDLLIGEEYTVELAQKRQEIIDYELQSL